MVATGSSIVANFDRLGIQLTMTGFRAIGTFTPESSGYRDGELNERTLTVTPGVGGSLQVGPKALAVDRIELNITDLSASGDALNLSENSVSTLISARNAIASVDLAINTISNVRSDLGAQQNRLGFTIARNNHAIENMQASESLIRDADIAEEVTQFTRSQIMVQASTALMTQANAIPQNALTLLQ